MFSEVRLNSPFIRIVAFLILSVCTTPLLAQQDVVVAVVRDAQTDRLAAEQQKYIDELLALTRNEFNIQIRIFESKWSKEETWIIGAEQGTNLLKTE